jgi:hypothetical protein
MRLWKNVRLTTRVYGFDSVQMITEGTKLMIKQHTLRWQIFAGTNIRYFCDFVQKQIKYS